MKRLSFIVALLVCSCRDTALPSTPPPPAAGTIQGTLVYAVPGKSELHPAANARITVMGTGLAATADAEGRFLLAGISRSNGILLLEFTLEKVNRQRLFRLEDLGTGVGRDISLGQVVLARNALVRGQVVLADVPGTTGLGGVTVYVPGGPWSVLTGDDGSYALDALPEGALQVAFVNKGYAVGSLDASGRGRR